MHYLDSKELFIRQEQEFVIKLFKITAFRSLPLFTRNFFPVATSTNKIESTA